ncbi:hypothetical protein [Kutzneria sp. NPDC051319]|uniref:hypothetical protein n=1 Tax=Kutzneria sp. NPDC051319 TaxID=3155047 RepID=UPI00341FA60A
MTTPVPVSTLSCWFLAMDMVVRLGKVTSHAGERVWLQGISLKSFFEWGKVNAALCRALDNGVDVRILLDPDSERAKFRSYREHDLSDHY